MDEIEKLLEWCYLALNWFYHVCFCACTGPRSRHCTVHLPERQTWASQSACYCWSIFFMVRWVFLFTLIISMPGNHRDHQNRAPELFAWCFFKVALVEEFSKSVFIRFILFRNKNFNEPLTELYTQPWRVWACNAWEHFICLSPVSRLASCECLQLYPHMRALLSRWIPWPRKIHNKNCITVCWRLSPQPYSTACMDYFLFITFVPHLIGSLCRWL